MTFQRVDSSNLEKFAYDEAAKRLFIVFARSGKTYQYDGVPPSVVQGLINEANRKLFNPDASVGRYFNQNIRSEFPFEEIDESDVQIGGASPAAPGKIPFKWVDLNSRISVFF